MRFESRELLEGLRGGDVAVSALWAFFAWDPAFSQSLVMMPRGGKREFGFLGYKVFYSRPFMGIINVMIIFVYF